MDVTLESIYGEVKERIGRVDFSRLWKGFHPFRFALYTDSQCYFDGNYIQKTDEFCANTSILFQGEHIAIWKLSEMPKDIDRLAASLIHEMFHAFQSASGESRFPDEREAVFRYRYSAENLSAKLREAELIRQILEGEGNAGEMYRRLLSLRRSRAERHPYEYAYEAGVEQIEGTANYVEASALTQLNPEKGETVWKRILEKISRPENYFPVRIISYQIGAAMIACVKRCSDADCESFGKQPLALEILPKAGDGTEPLPVDGEAERRVKQYLEETHDLVQAAVQKNDIVLSGRFPLVSVNIWDARSEGNYVTSNIFLMYRDKGENKTIYGDFVIETDRDYNILTVYRK